MATEFNVFYLGELRNMDPFEGDNTAEDARFLVGLSFGTRDNPLLNNIAEFTPGRLSFNTGSGPTNAYTQNNFLGNNTFKINGGIDQTFDSSATFFATITYVDGTSANITAVIFQDTAGKTYLAPEFSANTDQAALTAKPIQTLKLDRLELNTYNGMTANRQNGAFLTCYVTGTLIRTADGDRAIETLAIGDLVMTKDHGPRAIRWIGHSTVKGMGKLAPIRISAGALGPNIPARDLLVSRQHRMLVSSKICQRMFGSDDLLVPAIKLISLPGIEIAETDADVTYYHLLTDAHDVIFAEGAASETLLTGSVAVQALGPDYVAEIDAIFPGLSLMEPVPARPIARGKKVDQLIARHEKHQLPLAS